MERIEKGVTMEVVGYECYANGTVKLKVMPLKETKHHKRADEQFYGCEIEQPKLSKETKEENPEIWFIVPG